jgi:hypothetical protein
MSDCKFNIVIAILPTGLCKISTNLSVEKTKQMLKPSNELLSSMPCLDKFSHKIIKVRDGKSKDKKALLETLKNSDEKTFVIHIRSNLVTYTDPDVIIKFLYDLCKQYMESKSGDDMHFDLFYLTKWEDRCDRFEQIGNALTGVSNLVKTTRPHGLDAVLITPSGCEKIKQVINSIHGFPPSLLITNLITDGKIYAITTTPSILHYDVNTIVDPIDYVKTHECAHIPIHKQGKSSRGSNLSIFMFVIILLTVLFVFYFIVKYIYKENTNNTDFPGHPYGNLSNESIPRKHINVGN